MRSGEEKRKKDSWDIGNIEKETGDLGLNYGREDGEKKDGFER